MGWINEATTTQATSAKIHEGGCQIMLLRINCKKKMGLPMGYRVHTTELH